MKFSPFYGLEWPLKHSSTLRPFAADGHNFSLKPYTGYTKKHCLDPAVLCTLLGVMGVKAIMDHHGKYVTEDEIENRVQEMEDIYSAHHLMTRSEYMNSLKQ